MQHDTGVLGESWTSSGAVIVLTGEASDLVAVAQDLDIPAEIVVATSRDRGALALWGAALNAYRARQEAASISSESSVV